MFFVSSDGSLINQLNVMIIILVHALFAHRFHDEILNDAHATNRLLKKILVVWAVGNGELHLIRVFASDPRRIIARGSLDDDIPKLMSESFPGSEVALVLVHSEGNLAMVEISLVVCHHASLVHAVAVKDSTAIDRLLGLRIALGHFFDVDTRREVVRMAN